MSDRVRVEIVESVAYVSLDRPEKLNGLDLDTLEELVDAARRIKADRSIRGVILQGSGKAFSAGLDFASAGKQPKRMAKAFAKLPGQKTNLFQRACWVWRELPVPVIAVVHGHCFGGGLQLALAADFRFSTPDCTFSVMEAKWGLIPDMTGTVTLRELAAMDVVKRLAMTAEIFDGKQAFEWGLVTGVDEDPLAQARELLAQIMTRSPDAVAATKTLLHKSWNKAPRGAFWVESRVQLALMRGKNYQIARAANSAKKLPEFVLRKFG
ncbi:crotonase/enoyl-CoA hydratase family protein [Rhodococcus sp. ARC_M6]|uniref:crotonase/enoyl-CoA hydratase family protein n=1 Tax=Rhodococcus sp. ARC_M6 TaxID=2928852 RepID=UPI001FB441FF|nr:crotonase/enoyl-CoA hydratase family protein [Rhodococcus sp. ARC_M6]MCJ0905287.1 crotonase/enoyl-CoA hydratase family protein [Rhodococcus sp. ARC_M6]